MTFLEGEVFDSAYFGKDVFVYWVLLSQHPCPCSSNLLISYLTK
ncbi:uncharacterized protein METZ01_LOCUS152367, partial [marine metagenome]